MALKPAGQGPRERWREALRDCHLKEAPGEARRRPGRLPWGNTMCRASDPPRRCTFRTCPIWIPAPEGGR
jgi:hypothetical protein